MTLEDINTPLDLVALFKKLEVYNALDTGRTVKIKVDITLISTTKLGTQNSKIKTPEDISDAISMFDKQIDNAKSSTS